MNLTSRAISYLLDKGMCIEKNRFHLYRLGTKDCTYKILDFHGMKKDLLKVSEWEFENKEQAIKTFLEKVDEPEPVQVA